MSLVQVTTVSGVVKRHRGHDTPVVELNLGDHQRFIQFEIKEAPWMFYADDRVTTDWIWSGVVETRL